MGPRKIRKGRGMAEEIRESKRQELLEAGVLELDRYGIINFSVRRIAEACHVSPGAPYKHFHNRNEFIAEIIRYNYDRWFAELREIIAAHPRDYRAQIVELLISYVRFLVEHPHFRSLLMVKDDRFDESYRGLRGGLTKLTESIARKYCVQFGIEEEVYYRKVFILRSYMYGAALMFGNGEMEYDEKGIALVRRAAERELDLP